MLSTTYVYRATRAASAALVALAVSATMAFAQESTTRGLNLSFRLMGANVAIEDGDPGGGGGAGLRVGYGVNRTFTIFAGIDGTKLDVEEGDVTGDWNLAHADLGVRFHFANSLRSWVPYLEASVGARVVSVDDVDAEDDGETTTQSIDFSGSDFTVGGGLAVYLKENLALDVLLLYSVGEFSNVSIGNVTLGGLDFDAKSARFGVGLNWWP